ncbi:MAG TPA: baseplate J/gp47 family protein [Candidatus Dormibacteraeota bacterium]|nr:baseplate J/gp47 family protein [Candidatus Dormibacteraeota bacterium]
MQTTVQQAQESTSQQRNSTGKKDVPAVAATGSIVFTYAHAYCNPVCGGNAHLPKNTEVSTDDGKKFVTTADSSDVPPGSASQPIPIQAKVGGTAGNVGAGSIKNLTNNPDSTAFQVNNADATVNGAEATSKVVVSQTDLDTAKKDLGDPLAQKVKDDLKAKASGQKIIDETQTVTVDANYDHKAGDEAGNFNANVTAKGQATSFDENKMKEVLTNALKRQAPGGYQLTDDTPKLDYKVAQKDDKGMVIWDATASGFMAVAVNIDDLKKNVTGQSPAKARSYILGHIDASDVRISQVPSFVPWLPFLGARIDIKEQVQNNTPTQ